MILPLLVFIVVIIIIVISLKTEHFQNSTTSSGTMTEPATPTVVTRPVTATNISFTINTDIRPPAMTPVQQRNLLQFLITQVVNNFSVPDYEFNIQHSPIEAETETTTQTPETQAVSDQTEPVITEPTPVPQFNTAFQIRFTNLLDTCCY